MDEVRTYQANTLSEDVIDASLSPQMFLEAIDKGLKECSRSSSHSESLKDIFRALLKISKKPNNAGVACPCCMRSMDQDECKTFFERMTHLSTSRESELIQNLDEQFQQNNSKRLNYERWRKVMMEDNLFLNWQKANSLKIEIEDFESKIAERKKEYQASKIKEDESRKNMLKAKTDLSSIENALLEASRLRDDGTRLADKLSEVKSKKDRLNFMAPNASGKSF